MEPEASEVLVSLIGPLVGVMGCFSIGKLPPYTDPKIPAYLLALTGWAGNPLLP